jgi:TM2 domain-containing membrane protein YozV
MVAKDSSPSESSTPQVAGSAWLAAVIAWAIPGAGHFYLGRRARAVAFLALVLTSLGIGFFLDGSLYRMEPNQPLNNLFTLACMGMGAPYFISRFLFAYDGDILSPGYDYGSVFVITAGLMNLLLVLDAWDIGRGRKG